MKKKTIFKGSLWVLFALIGVCVIAITSHQGSDPIPKPATYHLHKSSYTPHPIVCVQSWTHKVKGVDTTTCTQWEYASEVNK